MSWMELLVAMLTLGQKAVATVVVLGMNLLVFLFMKWFVVFSLIPSLMMLGVLLKR